MPAATVSGRHNHAGSGLTFDYSELKSGNTGGGRRGIKISAEGVPDSVFELWLKENPHDTGNAYNDNHNTFYANLTSAILKDLPLRKIKPVAFVKHTDENTAPPGYKGPKWNTSKKPQQQKKVKEYNDAGPGIAADEVKAKQIQALGKHFKSMINKKVHVGNEQYTLVKS